METRVVFESNGWGVHTGRQTLLDFLCLLGVGIIQDQGVQVSVRSDLQLGLVVTGLRGLLNSSSYMYC